MEQQEPSEQDLRWPSRDRARQSQIEESYRHNDFPENRCQPLLRRGWISIAAIAAPLQAHLRCKHTQKSLPLEKSGSSQKRQWRYRLHIKQAATGGTSAIAQI